MKLRWNILYLITLAFLFVGFMARYVPDLPGELLGGLAGGLVTLVAAVARELIEDRPSTAGQMASVFSSTPAGCPRCSETDAKPKEEEQP